MLTRQAPTPQPVLDALAATTLACKAWAPTEVKSPQQLSAPPEAEICEMLILNLRPTVAAYQSGLIVAGGAAFAGLFLLFTIWGAWRSYKRMTRKTPAT